MQKNQTDKDDKLVNFRDDFRRGNDNVRKKDVNKKGKTSKKNIDFVSNKMFCSDVIFLKAIRKGIPKLSFNLGTT